MGGCPAVSWASNADEAKTSAATNNEAYILYFCKDDVATVTGGGSAARADYIKKNNKAPKTTVFDIPTVLASMKKAGINSMAKVPAVAENKATYKKYRAGLNTMLIVAPNGKTLATFAGNNLKQVKVMKFFETFKKHFEQWKKAEAKKAKKKS